LGKLDKAFLILLLCYIVLLFVVPASGFVTFLQFVLFMLGAWLVIRLSRFALRKAIWRLRNRILVTYVLIAVVPILLILTLAGLGTYVLAGQVAVYLARSELDRLVGSMQAAAETLRHTNPLIRTETLRRTGEIYGERFPRLFLMIDDHGNLLHWPAEPAIRVAPVTDETSSGVASFEGRYYAWAQSSDKGMRFIAATPLTRRYLSEMVPGLGDVYLLHVSTKLDLRPENKRGTPIGKSASKQSSAELGDKEVELLASGHEAPGRALPPPVNSFDLDVRWISLLPVKDWLDPERTDTALMVVRTRYSAILNIILSQKVDQLQGFVPIALLVVSIAFLVVEMIALIIGVSLTRTVTGAVHSLYEGTQRVMQGDFSHRISVSGRDQLADLSKSFNSMTENLEKLLIVAKEKERLQAELALALEVQEQLYPKTAPIFKTIRITGMCQPARMVSGDYYDYQRLSANRLAFAIGDVAGKGISAALLMAGIQSAMRMELRASLEMATPSARTNGFRLSTARLVSELNQQLHATTSPEKFATFCIGLYDDETGMLTYTNAGHLPPILIHNGSSTLLDINGTVVGAFPTSKYDESKVELRAGDLLVCYTDGITEPENEYGEMFGEERLIELVSKNADRDDHRVIEVVMDAVRQWTGAPELSDDMTVLLARKQ
jgi:sigma-B regulation protein RsbU (phosphoserine phosphatase)